MLSNPHYFATDYFKALSEIKILISTIFLLKEKSFANQINSI